MRFPDTIFHFEAGRRKTIIALNQAAEQNTPVFLLTQKYDDHDAPTFAHGDFYKVGVVARVVQMIRVSKDTIRVVTECIARACVMQVVQEAPLIRVDVREMLCKPVPKNDRAVATFRSATEYFEEYSQEAALAEPEQYQKIRRSGDLMLLSHFLGSVLPLRQELAQDILEQDDVEVRLQQFMVFMDREIELLRTENEIQDKVKQQMDRNQREYYLREQMKVISDELGDGDSPAQEADEYRAKVRGAASCRRNRRKSCCNECDKLAKMPFGSHEATVVREYLDTCLGLPWNTQTTDRIDLAAAEEILDRDHYGLKKVKERILETAGRAPACSRMIHGQIICLVGPPGVGKTSIARSIAQAMNRKYVRVSLGGVHDEAEIRGHRKTYIGAMPGRIMAAIEQAGIVQSADAARRDR